MNIHTKWYKWSLIALHVVIFITNAVIKIFLFSETLGLQNYGHGTVDLGQVPGGI